MSNKIIQPTYVTNLPSDGTKVTFRPFTVKEEKSLLLALQENDLPTVVAAIKSVIAVCTDYRVDPDKIPYYDSEYLFLKIRAKSVGEVIDMTGSCECSDKAKTEFEVDIDTMTVSPEPSKTNTFVIPDTIYTIKIRHPSIENFSDIFSDKDVSVEVVADCIYSVYSSEEVFDWDLPKKIEFVQSMTPKQQKNIAKFIQNMPLVKLPAKYKCVACGKQHEFTLSGFSNFFV